MTYDRRNAYLTQRLIDTCLRENLFSLVSSGHLIHQLPNRLLNFPLKLTDKHTWLVMETEQSQVYLPIVATDYMQVWRYTGDAWLEETSESVGLKQTYQDWILWLKRGRSADSIELLDHYLKELDCAAEQGALCQQAFETQMHRLMQPIASLKSWYEKALLADQIASYLDHPYYPSARAKFGFSEQDLKKYAPEFSPSFSLNWIAIDSKSATVTSEPPACWPTMKDVGLAGLENCVLFPVHPMTFATLDDLPDGIIKAPKAFLEVTPTLSVRTVSVSLMPHVHIKVPLMMRTLGSKNIRLVKPTTIYDGHWFERLLTHLSHLDSELSGLYTHCQEEHGGHMGDNALFTYIVRQYPTQKVSDKTLVPVAALAAPMPDQRLFLEHLADQYYQSDILAWFTDYVAQLNRIHLTLWLRYGIALESNQQNAILAFDPNGKMTMVMKDNDAARIWPTRFQPFEADAPVSCDELLDKRILVEDELALGQMYSTITLQLDMAALIEAIGKAGIVQPSALYQIIQQSIDHTLSHLAQTGCDTEFARQLLLEDDMLYAKYLLSSGSLLSKQTSGAADINKFYGKTAPNFLKQSQRFTGSSEQFHTERRLYRQKGTECPSIG
ncbi:IucA/IucC family protein [Marinomonas shanghaiensis]|uniref:IucA/IucC family protein n=1 Tax=Marinomonas shanghaiensis TaxID=2202418 RepID=UPI003A8E9039